MNRILIFALLTSHAQSFYCLLINQTRRKKNLEDNLIKEEFGICAVEIMF